ncbi:MAG: ABC transporter ATP-binding protein [Sphaerochaetaceae bacterium]|jgi:iron complex transport system ATP-binding protein
MSSAIVMKHIHFSYREKSMFNDVSVSFPQGEFTSLIGPNGSGKTTLIRHLIRQLTPTKGSLYLGNKEISSFNQKELARSLSYVPQYSPIEYDFTVYESVAMGRYAHQGRFSVLDSRDHSIIQDSLRMMNLDNLSHRNIIELSGGEYQRMLISRAIAQQSRIMVLDEPVSHLDIHHQKEILQLLRNLVDEKQVTVITTLHDLNAVSAFSDHVVMLLDGAIVAQGEVEHVLTKEKLEQVYNVEVDIEVFGHKPLILPRWNENQFS